MAPLQPSTSGVHVLPSRRQPGLLHLQSCGDLSTFVSAGRPRAERRPRRVEAERPHSLIGVIRETVLWTSGARLLQWPEEREGRWAPEGRRPLWGEGPSFSSCGLLAGSWGFPLGTPQKGGHFRGHLFLLFGSPFCWLRVFKGELAGSPRVVWSWVSSSWRPCDSSISLSSTGFPALVWAEMGLMSLCPSPLMALFLTERSVTGRTDLPGCFWQLLQLRTAQWERNWQGSRTTNPESAIVKPHLRSPWNYAL